jgi:hypothetical protein
MFKVKKANYMGIGFLLVMSSFIFALAVTMFILYYGISADYIIFNLQNVTDSLATSGVISEASRGVAESSGLQFMGIIDLVDVVWLLSYVLFVISTLYYAYKMRNADEIGMFAFLFYGIMLVLFIGGLFEQITNWLWNTVALNLLPNVASYVPMFTFYLSNVGVINFIHLLVIIVISKLNFNFAFRKQSNEQELKAIEQSNEVV